MGYPQIIRIPLDLRNLNLKTMLIGLSIVNLHFVVPSLMETPICTLTLILVKNI